MEKTLPASPPAHALAFLLWFSTLAVGTCLLALSLLVATKRFSEACDLALACSCFAALLSSPILVALPFGLRWAFTAAPVRHRWARLLVVLLGLFGVAACCGYYFSIHSGLHFSWSELCQVIVPYLPAALLAAVCLYRPWLLRS